MSNHATIQARPRVDDRWKHECRNELNTCLDGCSSGMRQLGRLGDRLEQLDRTLEPLRRAEAVEVREAGHELARASQRIGELRQRLGTLEREQQVQAQRGRQLTHEADQRGRSMVRDLEESRQGLIALRRDLAQVTTEAAAVGRTVETAFRRASELVADLDREAARGRRIEASLDSAWAQGGSVLQTLRSANDTWAALSTELASAAQTCETRLAESNLLVDALTSSESAAFAVWRGLREQAWEIAEYQVRESGVELLLQDSRQRRVAFEISRREHSGEDLLLELDLSGFDAEGESCECDEQLEELLEEIADLLAIESTRVERPHRRGAGGSRLKTPAIQADRPVTRVRPRREKAR